MNVQGLTFPIEIGQIPLFETLNPDYCINVVCTNSDEDQIFIPLYASTHRNRKHTVNLLLLDAGESRHYVLIRNLSRLLSARNSHNGEIFPCPHCLYCFATEDGKLKHLKECGTHGVQHVKYPAPNSTLQFSNIQHQMPIPFTIYADFECFLSKTDLQAGNSTKFHDIHTPSGFCCLTVSTFAEHNNERPYVFSTRNDGSDVVDAFFTHLKSEHVRINSILAVDKPMNKLTQSQLESYANCQNCPSCDVHFNGNKVRHHCHVTGQFVSALCLNCNLQYKYKMRKIDQDNWAYMVPVVLHNLKGYDSHVIIKNLDRFFAPKDVNVIATNMEKYMAFEIEGLRFVDSLQFLNCSLDTLVKNLTKDGNSKFAHMRRLFPNDEQFQLLLRKGVYPYEYMDCVERMKETCLPSQDRFFSRLTDENIGDGDYDHAQDVWSKFDMRTMRNYHDLYLETDVILLADVFEEFRKMSLNYYRLDPLHYVSSPGLSWDACLKMTKVDLELISDPDQYLFIEKGMRGGVSMISNRYAKANNPYLAQGYDPNVESSYIMYLDCNNLYGFAMSEPLPTGKFRFLDPDELEDFDLRSKSDDDTKGFILEVDLEYPPHLHNPHNDYPLAPEKMAISDDMLSPYAHELAGKLKMKHNNKISKLIPNLYAKTNYVLHYRNLQFYVAMGLKITKIHKILEFDQSRWLKPYIDFNTIKRQAANNAFEKDLFKLMNNSVYGKTMQNNRKHLCVKLVTTELRAKRFIARPTFQSFNIINKDVTMIKLIKADVLLDRPIYVGMSILDISKLHMYRFHYEHMVNAYGERATLLFTDTDSLCYHIRTDDVYLDMRQDMTHYDTSDYHADHFLYSKSNAKVIGKFKDESNGQPPLEFVGLRSKMYSLLLPKDYEKKTAKGVKKSYVSKYIRHSDYRNCLFAEETTTANFFTIRSIKHQLHTTEITKSALSPYDDKRYLIDNSASLAYGHIDTPVA